MLLQMAFFDAFLWLSNMVARQGWEEGVVREFGMDVYASLYVKWITNKDLLYTTWNSVQCYVAAWVGEVSGGEWIHVCV